MQCVVVVVLLLILFFSHNFLGEVFTTAGIDDLFLLGSCGGRGSGGSPTVTAAVGAGDGWRGGTTSGVGLATYGRPMTSGVNRCTLLC